MKILFMMIWTIITINISAQTANIKVIVDDNKIVGTIDIPKGLHQTLQKDFFNIEVEKVENIKFSETIYPKGHKNEVLNTIEFSGKITLIKPFTYAQKLKSAINAKVTINYQLCKDNGACLFPQSKEFNIIIQTQKPSGLKKSNSLLKYLIMAFLGGLILNVMPCVLPVLSIKAISLVNQRGLENKVILKHSLTYAVGVILSFIILAIVVIIMKKSGESVGWGFQFQNPYFVIILLSMMVLFALSLFDIFTFSAPGMQAANNASGKDGYFGSFMSGVFAVLLATPCTAPMLGAALGFAFLQSPRIIIILFVTIGIGLAFPFIIIGFIPKTINFLPKPGVWMNTFKQIMGFLLLGTVIYLFRILYFQLSGDELINILWFILLLSFSAWIYGNYATPMKSKKTQWTAIIVSILLISISWSNFVHISQNKESMVKKKYSNWQTFTPELLAAYIAENKMVFVDFSAEWCMTCKTNELLVLNTDKIQNLFKSKDVQLLLGDNTNNNPIVNKWLKKYNRAGVPLYLLFIPNQKDPIIFSEILTKEMIINSINPQKREK